MRLRAVLVLLLAAFPRPCLAQTTTWPITLEEPTGIERRDDEVVVAPVTFAPGEVRETDLRVLDPDRHEVPSQIRTIERHPDGSAKRVEVLFRATLIPGARPEYTLLAQHQAPSLAEPGGGIRVVGGYPTELVVRRIGTSRLEMGNARFGVIVNLGRDGSTPAIVEAYNRTAGPERVLNLVETTPDQQAPLAMGARSAGWSTAAERGERTAGFTNVDIVESGPLRARVRLTGAVIGAAAETWEFEWSAGSPVLTWRASLATPAGRYGYVVSSLSAAPYEPFTRWIDGSESRWPSGPDTDDPPDHPIGAATLDDLPGGQVVYYDRQADYGALAFVETDRRLRWVGIGSSQFVASWPAAPDPAATSLAIAFPRWKGTETILEARADARRYLSPVIAQVGAQARAASPVAFVPAPRAADYEVREEPATGEPGWDGDVPRVPLDGEWRLQDARKGEGERLSWWGDTFDDRSWHAVQVPGTVHAQVLGYAASFTPGADWISTREWWYRRRFRLPAGFPAAHARLRFGATDYYADVWVNGVRAGSHEGYIDPWEIDVAALLRPDAENVIAVRVWTPVSYYWRHRPYTIKGAYGAVDQKPDDITPVGITRPAAIVGYGPVRVEDRSVRTSINADGSAEVEVQVSLGSQGPPEGELELLLQPRNFDDRSALRARVPLDQASIGSARAVTVRFHVATPRLWWTRDHGRPNLYTLAARVSSEGRVSDAWTQAVGIREIEKVGWVFYLNGHRLFIRGTNSYYFELFMSEMTREKYRRDLQTIADMNVNMIRLHCHFQNPEFYETTDELGVLVWQDYLEAWYPHDRDFALRAAQLYDDHIRMVRDHPSVALWATSDEEDLENYRVLTKHLAGRLFVRDPQHRAVVRSTGRYGDGHVYEGWYGGTIWAYARTEESFISELGATALPAYESLVKFLPDAWPIEEHRDEWIFHKLQIDEAMRAWGRPGTRSLRDYIPGTQAYVARLHQLAIERMRRRKYEAGGILHFHAIDFWPSVTMAAVDYYRVPTRSYATVQRSFQPVLASVEYDRDVFTDGEPVTFPLWVTNDTWASIPGASVAWRVVGAEGAVLASGELAVSIEADASARIGTIRWTPAATGPVQLLTEVRGPDGSRLSENVYDFTIASR